MRDYTLLICINIYFGRDFLFRTLKSKSAARQRWMSRAAEFVLPCSRKDSARQQISVRGERIYSLVIGINFTGPNKPEGTVCQCPYPPFL